MCACSNTKNKNELADLYEKGYEHTSTCLSDNKWTAIYQKDGSYVDAYKVEINMDQKTYDKLLQIDMFEEEGLKEFLDIIEYLPDCKVTSLNDYLPSAGEFNKYIGLTIQDLENDGYERNGYTYDDEGCIFFAEGPMYSINVIVDEVITDETIDNYSENDIRALTIKEIEFTGISYNMIY